LKRQVSVNVMPLENIIPFVTGEELFIFLRKNQSKLQGTLMLDAIFSELWP